MPGSIRQRIFGIGNSSTGLLLWLEHPIVLGQRIDLGPQVCAHSFEKLFATVSGTLVL